MQFIYANGENPDFIELCRGLDDFLNELVGGEENRAEYIPYNRLCDIHDAIIAYDGEIPVGCAAFKKYDDECAEVKRVFIKPEYRGQRNFTRTYEAAGKRRKGTRFPPTDFGIWRRASRGNVALQKNRI